MSFKAKLIVAISLGVFCLFALIFSFATRSSLDEYIAKTYEAAPAGAVPGATATTRTYVSPASPTDTADAIARKWKPAERLNQPTGVFLRYRERIVAVTPNPAGGSFISVDDQRNGYNRWFGYIGGYWGSGGGGGFRGGGPGAGK